ADFNHGNPDRRSFAGPLPPGLLQRFIKAATVGNTGERVDQGEPLEALIGGAQLALAPGELLRHVVERGGKRLELLGPALPLRPRSEVAAPEPGGGPGDRA